MWDVTEELKSRNGDQRRALVQLYGHPNAQTRVKAAIATLTVAPEAAKEVLRQIVANGEYPQAMDAAMILRDVADGSFTPK